MMKLECADCAQRQGGPARFLSESFCGCILGQPLGKPCSSTGCSRLRGSCDSRHQGRLSFPAGWLPLVPPPLAPYPLEGGGERATLRPQGAESNEAGTGEVLASAVVGKKKNRPGKNRRNRRHKLMSAVAGQLGSQCHASAAGDLHAGDAATPIRLGATSHCVAAAPFVTARGVVKTGRSKRWWVMAIAALGVITCFLWRKSSTISFTISATFCCRLPWLFALTGPFLFAFALPARESALVRPSSPRIPAHRPRPPAQLLLGSRFSGPAAVRESEAPHGTQAKDDVTALQRAMAAGTWSVGGKAAARTDWQHRVAFGNPRAGCVGCHQCGTEHQQLIVLRGRGSLDGEGIPSWEGYRGLGDHPTC
jgi:hypothetical protein